ncbi:MAG: cytochrome c oxidase assembly protein [Acidimicrobiales bacterium]|jgi:putative membrane protein
MKIMPFSWHHLNHWDLGVLPFLLLVGAGLLYFYWGVRRAGSWPRVRSVCFLLGLLVTFIATQTFIGAYDMEYFSDHMIQHLLLIMVAAPLFALSAPLDLAYKSGNAAIRRFLDSKFMEVVTHPLFAFALYFAFIPFTHLTGFMNLMMTHMWIHHLEQIGFLVVGYLFFRAAFGLERGYKIHPGLRLVYVMAAVPVDTFTGLVLSMSSRNPFSNYAAMAPTGASQAWILSNIKLGGGIMWIGGDALMLLALIPIAFMWVKWETERTKELDKILDAQGI